MKTERREKSKPKAIIFESAKSKNKQVSNNAL